MLRSCLLQLTMALNTFMYCLLLITAGIEPQCFLLFPCPFLLQTDIIFCSHLFALCVRSLYCLGLQHREMCAEGEYLCYQPASKKCRLYFLEHALPRQIFPFQNQNSPYLPYSNSFLVNGAYPRYYAPLDFSITHGLSLVLSLIILFSIQQNPFAFL